MKKTLFSVCIFLLATAVVADPIVFETDAAKVIVVRPIDQWSGDKSLLESSLDAHKNHTAWYTLKLSNKKFLFGNPNLTQPRSDHPITNSISKKLEQTGFELPRSSANSFTVQLPVNVPTAALQEVFTYQMAIFKDAVVNQGDPEKLQSKTSRNKFLGGLISLATVAVAADKFGATAGSHATLGSGISDTLYKAVSQYSGGMAPVDLSGQDIAQRCDQPACRFKEVELRKVTTAAPDRVGQIVIAYKDEKTPEAEEAALVQAIFLLTGANSTTTEIEKNRNEDFQRRKSIWASCVAEGKKPCSE